MFFMPFCLVWSLCATPWQSFWNKIPQKWKTFGSAWKVFHWKATFGNYRDFCLLSTPHFEFAIALSGVVCYQGYTVECAVLFHCACMKIQYHRIFQCRGAHKVLTYCQYLNQRRCSSAPEVYFKHFQELRVEIQWYDFQKVFSCAEWHQGHCAQMKWILLFDVLMQRHISLPYLLCGCWYLACI